MDRRTCLKALAATVVAPLAVPTGADADEWCEFSNRTHAYRFDLPDGIRTTNGTTFDNVEWWWITGERDDSNLRGVIKLFGQPPQLMRNLRVVRRPSP